MEKPSRRIRLKKKRIAFLVTVLVFLIITITALRGINSLNSMYVSDAWTESLSYANGSQRVNILIAGVDYREDGRNIIQQTVLVSYSPQADKVAAIYIPEKTYVNKDDYGGGSLEKFYALEDSSQRAARFIDIVSGLLNIPVHYFVEFDYRGIPEAVELAGQLELEITEPLYQEQRMLFEEGKQAIAGEEAYRYYSSKMEGEGPLDQLERQRSLTAALIDNIGKKGMFTGLPTAVRTLSSHLQTNLSWRETVHYYDIFKEKSYEEDVILEKLPGSLDIRDGEEFWVADEELTQKLVDRLILEKEESVVSDIAKVEVLNGKGTPEIAKQVAEELSQKGYDIVEVEDADHQDYSRSLVVSRIEDMDPAKDIAVLIPGAQLLKEVISDHPAHITLIIGHNYSEKELTEADE